MRNINEPVFATEERCRVCAECWTFCKQVELIAIYEDIFIELY